MEPLRIGVSARLLYPDPSRKFLPGKSIQYLEQSVANWLMSGDVLAFMIPEISLASHHLPKALKVKHYVDALDGLLLQGGEDMSPESYRETPINPKWSGDNVRDRYEIELFHEFVTQGKPVFGICRGHQVINVALGGSLVQHLDDHDARAIGRSHLAHGITVSPTSELGRAAGASMLRVNSLHHQAVRELAPGLIESARGDDGTVEGLETSDGLVVAVQCHPEELTVDMPWARTLFERFVARAGSHTPRS